jgi:hypothetical protein
MRSHWIGLTLAVVSPLAAAQTTIYKHVDEAGRVTYSNKPMRGAIVLALEPLSTIPGLPRAASAPEKTAVVAEPTTTLKPAVAVVTPRPAALTVASIDRHQPADAQVLRRRNLESELEQAQTSLAQARKSLLQEQRNPVLIAAVRAAQQAVDPTPAQQAEFRANVERASGRIRGLQAIVAEHEKNIEALQNELGELKP